MNQPPTWRKSSYSSADASDCVEVADLPGGTRGVRDSKRPDPWLAIRHERWRDFVTAVKSGALAG